MRTSPSLIYSPHTPRKSNMTLYEMSESMSETNDAQEAFPYLIKWLLKDFWSNYRYNGIPYSEEYAYNIAYFTVYNFINREICHSKPEVFRSKFLKEIVNMNLDHDFYDVLSTLKNSKVDLTREVNTTDNKTNNSSGTTTNNLLTSLNETDKTSGTNVLAHNTSDVAEATSTSKNEASGTGSTETTNTNTETLNTSNVTDSDSTSSSTNSNSSTTQETITNDNKQRTVNTDYPQSTVNTTTIGSWDYASGAQDIDVDNSQTTNNTTTNSGTSSSTNSTDTTVTNTGTIKNDGSGSNNSTSSSSSTTNNSGTTTVSRSGDDTTTINNTDTKTSSTSNTGTVSFDNESTDNRLLDVTEKWSGMTGLELNMHQIEMFDKFKSFYNKLLTRLENCFISVYVDEERDGYLDPSINLMSAWNN